MTTYKILTEPKAGSAAAEYAGMSLNIYKGCTHGCKYCYVPPILRKMAPEFHSNPDPKKDVGTRLRADLKRLNKPDERVFLSFVGDVYQPCEKELQLTRECLQILNEFNQPWNVLTKNPCLALRDIDLFMAGNSMMGITLISTNRGFLSEWEPGAPGPDDRMAALKQFHDAGIQTWISLEPVIEPADALAVIEACHSFVDVFKIGKINHMSGLENSKDWRKFRADAETLLNGLGCEYVFKASLGGKTNNKIGDQK